MAFATLGLNELILKAVQDTGYTTPTPVQQAAIPPALLGRDLVVSAQTGSGKTAAFMLPALQRLAVEPQSKIRGPRVLVLTPTRELAAQVTEACKTYGKNMRYAKAVSVVGGMPYPAQNRLLSSPYDILVATPGRLMDQMDRGRIDFGRLEVLVLDEADRMLDMGFVEDIESIVARLPAERQTLFFSATLDGQVAHMMQRLLRDPLRIEIDSAQSRHENIEQRLLVADDNGHKQRLLDHLLRDTEMEQAIVFTATKRDAEFLANDLEGRGFSAAALHGDMQQRQRTRTLDHLRRGELRVLVATDVAARGIDVPGISHVINYDLPKVAADYVHRIGRTGRGGASGIAISLASRGDIRLLRAIERYTQQPIKPHTIPGLEPRQPMPTSERSGPRRSGSGGYGQRGNGGGFGQPRSGARPSFGDRSAGPRTDREGRPQRDGAPRTWGPSDGQRSSFGDRSRGEANGNRADSRPEANGNRADYPAKRSFGDQNAAPRTFTNNREGGRSSFGDGNRGGFGAKPRTGRYGNDR
ncbi:MAG: DEAD/DEAH box helicase [Zoogloea sp.]|nr:DEAD/DEAH box helicase [Zoogloea sp.]